ncbi:transglycosylase domain-containing protein [Actinokineospora bangkokensis]|uniref:Penicillin-binding protein n=1 Tax=Actinokineospora bangkokensis TaxID=1193682 RepID=A0A1Q9LSS8_9PSEU|nr:transglycosylase domain-containing protein [Actinokineospora bangkokensis]OLR95044.1 penicillin-binding protein [Actinokineospora bangkokensis]
MRRVLKFLGGCGVAGVLVAGMVAPAVAGAGVVAAAVADEPPVTLDQQLPGVTTLTDRDGNVIARVFDQYRLPLAASAISSTMKAAIVSIEDRRFYTSSGVDPKGLLRAAINNAAGGATQGASTITQQLVKNYLINVVHRDDPQAQAQDRADTVTRKVREARSAIELDASMGKDDILAAYLNVVEFGGRVYGVGAAAQAYFGTTADKLDMPQAALLAGMVNNPTAFDPYDHPQATLERRDVVIDAMVSAGTLDAATAATAKAAPLGVLPNGPVVPASTCTGTADGFFCDYALSYLQSAGFTQEQLMTGGYTIRTTLDPAATAAAQRAVDDNVDPTEDGVANTLALVRPGTGDHQVLAMVSNRRLGTDAAKGQTSTNVVSGVSDPFGAGSVFKVFTAAAALESGAADLGTLLPNPTSQCFRAAGSRSCYTVRNDGTYPDPITLTQGLATSPNTAFVGLEQKVGVPAVVAMASKLGLRTTMGTNNAGKAVDTTSADPQRNQTQTQYFQDKLSFTLGNSPVSPLELANVPATLLSGGVWCPPSPILSVTDRDGTTVPVTSAACEQVISPEVAATLNTALGEDTTIGTSAAAARAVGWDRPGIGKTGTTQNSESVAFVGGTGDYAASSLVFADGARPGELCAGPSVHLGNCGSGAFGGTVAAPPYFRTMTQLLGG